MAASPERKMFSGILGVVAGIGVLIAREVWKAQLRERVLSGDVFSSRRGVDIFQTANALGEVARYLDYMLYVAVGLVVIGVAYLIAAFNAKKGARTPTASPPTTG